MNTVSPSNAAFETMKIVGKVKVNDRESTGTY